MGSESVRTATRSLEAMNAVLLAYVLLQSPKNGLMESSVCRS
jgi:hypothetical protein